MIKLLDITALIYCINYRVIDCAIVTQFQTCTRNILDCDQSDYSSHIIRGIKEAAGGGKLENVVSHIN